MRLLWTIVWMVALGASLVGAKASGTQDETRLSTPQIADGQAYPTSPEPVGSLPFGSFSIEQLVSMLPEGIKDGASRLHAESFITLDFTTAALSFLLIVLLFLYIRHLRKGLKTKGAEEHRLRELLQSAPFPVIVTSLPLNEVIFTNERALQLFGLGQDEFYGAHLPDFWVLPEERAAFINTAVLYGTVKDSEVELKTSRGHQFWTQLSATRVKVGDGDALIITLQDVTERKRRDEELLLAQRKLEQANAQLQATLAELERMAHTDKLTGCWNRRHFEGVVSLEIGRARRYRQPLSMLVFDIDHFKRINDQFGHGIGDDVLSLLTSVIRPLLRESDLFTRWGGEEFVILALNTGHDEAIQIAEKLRKAVNDTVFPEVGLVTISFGVTEFSAQDSLETWFKRADAALYRAKAAGRNRVIGAPVDELLGTG